MKKLFFTFSILLSLALTVNAQIPSKVWLFDTPEWGVKQLFNAPEVVDDLAILADSLAPVTIENTNKVFAHPQWTYNFTKALRLGGPAITTPQMPLLPMARAVVFQMNGPGYIHIICLSSTLEPRQLLITDGKQLFHRITVPGNDFLDANGSQLPAFSYYHTRGISPIFIYAENGSIDLFLIEAETGLVDPVDPPVIGKVWVLGNDSANFPLSPGIGAGPDVSVFVDNLGIHTGGAITANMGQVEGSIKKFGDYTYNNRFKFNGGGYPGSMATDSVPTINMPTQRYLTMKVTGPGLIKVQGITGSSSSGRRLFVTDGVNLIGSVFFPPSTEISESEVYYAGGPAILYLFCNSAINLYRLEATSATEHNSGDFLHGQTVVFNVNVPAGTKECWIAGTFNGWNSSTHQMQMVDTLNYTLILADINMSTLEYKYLSGPDWKYGECNTYGQEIPNRTHQLNDTVANWYSIYDPGTQTSVTYTVKVPLGTNHVCIAGDFNNWNPGMHWMQQIDSVTYQITIQGATESMQYKYFNGPNWVYEEVSLTGQHVGNRKWTPLDQVAAWSNMIVPEQTRIFYDDIHTSTGEDIAIDIRISSNQPRQAIAYQFEFHFDASTLEYTGYTTQGTVANSGDVVVNSTKDVGVLYISFMTTQAFDIINSLIKLNFKVVNNYSYNQTSAWFYEFYLDDQQIHGYNPGTIFIANFMLGDVDGNQRVQAYDAALTLQYSVGMDPLPTIAPRPWEGWRLQAADVDGVAGITANDAAMILQYSAYLITSFDGDEPDSGSVRAPANKLVQVEIVRDQNMLYFKSFGNLVGFNLFIAQDLDAFGAPVISNDVSMSAVNVGTDIYAVGLAKLEPFADGTTFMTIPLLREVSSDFEYKMFINSDEVDVKAYAQTGVSSLADAGISLHPNPVRDMIRLTNLKDGSRIRVYDISGRMVLSTETFVSSENIDVSGLANGIYSISILNNGSSAVSKFIKY
ncbi:MAG: T9SS type A sorting domain-containing protein [Paludibacter sp.]|nr:T9SS type A sorting domain-containing protein [Paludibacter sp.]